MGKRRKAREVALQFLYALDVNAATDPGPHEEEFWERHPVDGHPWIGLLLVDGRLARRGYGRAIVTALEDRFRSEGAAAVRLGVLVGNAEALLDRGHVLSLDDLHRESMFLDMLDPLGTAAAPGCGRASGGTASTRSGAAPPRPPSPGNAAMQRLRQ